jgi:hypothetical protein
VGSNRAAVGLGNKEFRKMTVPTTCAIEAQDPTTAAALIEHARQIRELGKRTVDQIIEIGRRLIECRKLVGHGAWLPWLEREFGWSDRTARNFMRAYDLAGSKLEKFSDLSLPVSALYLLAAPSTPERVRDDVIARAEAGEAISTADVKEAIAQAKPVEDAITEEAKLTGAKSLNDDAIAEAKSLKNDAIEVEPVNQEMADILVARAAHTVVNGDATGIEDKKPTEKKLTKEEITAARTAAEVAHQADCLLLRWETVCEEARTAFLDKIGEQSLCAALSDEMRAKLQARFRAVFESRSRIAEHAAEDVTVAKKARKARREQAQRKAAEAQRLYHAPAASQAKIDFGQSPGSRRDRPSRRTAGGPALQCRASQ